MSLVSVVYCQVEVPASGRSLVQRSRTEFGVSNECNCESSLMRMLYPTGGCCALGKTTSTTFVVAWG